MDEPTSVLTPQAVEQLFETLARSSLAEGRSILYISHKLEEIRRAVRLRDRAARTGARWTGLVDPRARKRAPRPGPDA